MRYYAIGQYCELRPDGRVNSSAPRWWEILSGPHRSPVTAEDTLRWHRVMKDRDPGLPGRALISTRVVRHYYLTDYGLTEAPAAYKQPLPGFEGGK